jgi:hypothetical protein
VNRYTLLKSIEEAAEVAQAGAKVNLHNDRPAWDDFVGELADMQAMIRHAVPTLSKRHRAMFVEGVKARMEREERKGKIG